MRPGDIRAGVTLRRDRSVVRMTAPESDFESTLSWLDPSSKDFRPFDARPRHQASPTARDRRAERPSRTLTRCTSTLEGLAVAVTNQEPDLAREVEAEVARLLSDPGARWDWP
jgi:hypothetical protein